MTNYWIALIVVSLIIFITISNKRLKTIIWMKREGKEEVQKIFLKFTVVGIAGILFFIIKDLLNIPYINNNIYLPLRGGILFVLSIFNIVEIKI